MSKFLSFKLNFDQLHRFRKGIPNRWFVIGSSKFEVYNILQHQYGSLRLREIFLLIVQFCGPPNGKFQNLRF